VEIRKQIFHNESEEAEPQSTKRNMNILNLSDGFRMVDAGISLPADSDCKGEQPAAAGQKNVRLLLFFFFCCGTILKRKDTCVLSDSFTKSSLTLAKSQSIIKPSSS